MPPGKSFARPETAAALLATPADFGRQRPRYPGSPAAKPRKVKDYSDRGGKPFLRATAWWGWQKCPTRVISMACVYKQPYRYLLSLKDFLGELQTRPLRTLAAARARVSRSPTPAQPAG
jgi:hypothetical protein